MILRTSKGMLTNERFTFRSLFLTRYLLCSIALCLASLIAHQASACTVPASLRQSVQSLANLLSDGEAELASNSVECLKLNRSESKRDVPGYAVLFTIYGWRGSNAVTEYLSYFDDIEIENNVSQKDGEKYALIDFLIVGAGGWRQVNLQALEKNRTIILAGHDYKLTDPYCCPTIPVVVRYALRDSHLVQLTDKGGG